MFDAIIVGAGLSGATISRILADAGKKVLILERRNHIAGNLYDYIDEAGILVQKYGPHIFHTNNEEVKQFIHKYANWNPYNLVCGAVLNKTFTKTPFSFTTIEQFYEKDDAKKLIGALQNAYPDEKSVPVYELLKSENKLIAGFANFLFENDYRPYTAKQWGLEPEKIDASVLQRVPVYLLYNPGYFSDRYQYMPEKSFTAFVAALLDHKNIEVRIKTNALDDMALKDGDVYYKGEKYTGQVVYTGAVDELCQYQYGKLPYRSLRFEWKTESVDSIQDAPVVAYPQEEGYTRITEFKKLPVQEISGHTTYAVEFPLDYAKEKDAEPYYPIPNEESVSKYKQYADYLKSYSNLYLCGRLAEYKYYNMDQALERAIEVGNRIICAHEVV